MGVSVRSDGSGLFRSCSWLPTCSSGLSLSYSRICLRSLIHSNVYARQVPQGCAKGRHPGDGIPQGRLQQARERVAAFRPGLHPTRRGGQGGQDPRELPRYVNFSRVRSTMLARSNTTGIQPTPNIPSPLSTPSPQPSSNAHAVRTSRSLLPLFHIPYRFRDILLT